MNKKLIAIVCLVTILILTSFSYFQPWYRSGWSTEDAGMYLDIYVDKVTITTKGFGVIGLSPDYINQYTSSISELNQDELNFISIIGYLLIIILVLTMLGLIVVLLNLTRTDKKLNKWISLSFF